MRVALFTCRGLVAHITLNKIIPQMLDMGIEPVLFGRQDPDIERAKIPELKRISFLESGLLQNVVEPVLNDLPAHRSPDKLCYTVEQLVDWYGLQYEYIDKMNNSSFIDHLIDRKNITGAISIRYYHKFKPEIINRFNQNGFIWNMHTGLLPQYKGVHMPYRAIEKNEKYYGWTLHHVDENIDTGHIIATDKLPLDRNKPVLDTYLDMTEKGAAMIMGALMFYQKYGELKGLKQMTDHDSYFTYPTAQEMDKWDRDGIIFSNDIIETYVRYFTAPGTVQETLLRNSLLEATAPISQHVKVA